MKDYSYGTLAEFYDVLEFTEDFDNFNKLLDKLFKNFKVKSVLDLTCGTGLQAIYLHKKGYKVTASDYSKEMLAVAKKKYPVLKWRKGDMRTVKYGKFDAVISCFNAIGHLSKGGFEKALENVSNNLKDKGIYIFDIFNLDFMKKNFMYHQFMDVAKEVNDIKYVRFNKNKFNKKKAVMNMNQTTYVQKGMDKPKIFKESWDMQIYPSQELKKILNKNGFEVIQFLNMDGSKFNKNKSLFILTIARKKG